MTQKETAMITLRMIADVADDRRVVVTLPPEVPTGKTELVVTVESRQERLARGVPASDIRGIAAGSGPPPDDATVEQWVQEHRASKYE
jgi:hypothetical protein